MSTVSVEKNLPYKGMYRLPVADILSVFKAIELEVGDMLEVLHNAGATSGSRLTVNFNNNEIRLYLTGRT